MSFPLNGLQKKLEYKFINIQLLHEALTHDFKANNTEWDVFGDGNVFYRKRKLHRLRCVGVKVLKLLTAEKAIIIQGQIKHNRFSEEGFSTEIRKLFNKACDFYYVGHKLELWDYSHSTDSLHLRNPKIVKEIIQAIFGAVFIDGGGCESENFYAMQSVRKLFDLLINKYGLGCYQFPFSQELYNCFTVAHHFAREYLLTNDYAGNIKPFKSLEKRIGYKFNKPELIQTALTHDSVKGYISGVSHYEILEFLGDVVYELVICEYLYWHYINDRDGEKFNFRTITKFVSKTFQQPIANGLNLQRFITKPDNVTVNDIHDFLESIVGAIYIDAQSFIPIKNMLILLCRQFERETIKCSNVCLPFTWRTYYGSRHYWQYGKLGRILEEHELPPNRQDVFKIGNLDYLRARLGNYYDLNRMHGSIQSYDSNASILGSESWCNQQEFGRVSLFQTMIRIWYLRDKVHIYNVDNLLHENHTYDSVEMKYHRGTPEIAFSSVNYTKEPKLRDVCDAIYTIALWIYNWLMIFLSRLWKFGKALIKFVLGAVIIGLCIWKLLILEWPLFILLSICIIAAIHYIFSKVIIWLFRW